MKRVAILLVVERHGEQPEFNEDEVTEFLDALNTTSYGHEELGNLRYCVALTIDNAEHESHVSSWRQYILDPEKRR